MGGGAGKGGIKKRLRVIILKGMKRKKLLLILIRIDIVITFRYIRERVS